MAAIFAACYINEVIAGRGQREQNRSQQYSEFFNRRDNRTHNYESSHSFKWNWWMRVVRRRKISQFTEQPCQGVRKKDPRKLIPYQRHFQWFTVLSEKVDTASTQPRHSLDTASTQPRHGLDTASTQPRQTMQGTQDVCKMYARSLDAASTQPRHILDTASTQPRNSLDTA